MQDDLCELRLDVLLEDGADVRAFERSWQAALGARRLNAAKPAAVRFQLCWPGLDTARTIAWTHFLSARLAALPGSPVVATEPARTPTDWRGVRIWLAYPSHSLIGLLQNSRKTPATLARTRGHCS